MKWFKISGLALAALGTLFLSRPAAAAVIAGFNAAGEFNSPPVMTFVSSPYAPVEGSKYGTLGVDSSAPPVLTLSSPASFSSGNLLALSYGVTDSAAANYALEFTLGAQTLLTEPVAIAAVTGASTDWHRVGVSLNYARNLGLNTASPMAMSISGTDNFMCGLCDSVFTMSFDNLAIDETFTASVPNFPVNKPTVIINCGTRVYLNLGALTQNGSNNPVGFHIYRAPDVAGSPGTWSSMLYTTSTTYSDNSVATSSVYWYIAMPFDQVWSDANGGKLMYSSADGAHSSIPDQTSGPNEALIATYQAAKAIKLTVPSASTPNPPTGLTVTAACTSLIALAWNAASVGAGGCNVIVSYSIKRALDCAFTSGVVQLADQAGTSIVDNTVVSGTTYYYEVSSNDDIGQSSIYTTVCVLGSATGSNCTVPTATPVVTSTITPGPTSTPIPGKAFVFPNPFHPDKGECFHVGNIPVNTDIKIYDMVGKLVYATTFPISGSTCPGGWDGFNNNGQKVVTGVYHLLITPPGGSPTVYHVAVIRGN